MARLQASLLVLAAKIALAQTPTATITGEVKDQTGSTIVMAKVTLRNTGTNAQRSALTTDAGQYMVPLLPPGSYELVVEAPGFKRSVQSGIVLQVAQEARLNVRLELGQVSEVIEVKADAMLPETASCWERSGTPDAA